MQEYFDCLYGNTSEKLSMSKDEFIADSKALVLIYASLIIGATTSGESGLETRLH